VNLAGFDYNCLEEYTMHSLSPCYGLLRPLVLLKNVAKWCNTAKFFTKMVSFYMLVCMGIGRNFSRRGRLVDFSKRYSRVGQKWWNLVFTTRNYENSIFCWNFQIPALLPTPMCAGKVRATPSNKCNFKRFNTIPNSEILLNLICKMKYVTDQFNCVFVFVLATLSS